LKKKLKENRLNKFKREKVKINLRFLSFFSQTHSKSKWKK